MARSRKQLEALAKSANEDRTTFDTKHSHIGGWQNFDMVLFCKGRPKKIDNRIKQENLL